MFLTFANHGSGRSNATVSPKVVEAVRVARRQRQSDWASHCHMAGVRVSLAPPEEWSKEEDPWVVELDDERQDERLQDLDVWAFSDGSVH